MNLATEFKYLKNQLHGILQYSKELLYITVKNVFEVKIKNI